LTGARSGGRPRPCWHWLRCPRPGGRLRCTMTARGRGGGERRGGNCLRSRAAILVRAALAASRPLLSAGFDPGRCRGQKTPPTETRLRPPRGAVPVRATSVGAALAAIRPLLSAGFDAGRCRGQNTPPTEQRVRPQMGRDSCGRGLLTATRRLQAVGFDSGCYREQARSHEIGVSRAGCARCAGRNRTTRCRAWRRDWGTR
jgi:hypothetical protein